MAARDLARPSLIDHLGPTHRANMQRQGGIRIGRSLFTTARGGILHGMLELMTMTAVAAQLTAPLAATEAAQSQSGCGI